MLDIVVCDELITAKAVALVLGGVMLDGLLFEKIDLVLDRVVVLGPEVAGMAFEVIPKVFGAEVKSVVFEVVCWVAKVVV
jgi:hypothetical protein